MREYLFRGKSADNGEWVEGTYLHLNVGKDYICDGTVWIGTLQPCKIEVEPETVGQYTGLTDKNGVKIFEGDVIKVERDLHCGENKKEREIFNGVVWYDDKHTCFGIKSKKYRCLPIHRFKGDYSTIIGNIHDNSEILKEGEE